MATQFDPIAKDESLNTTEATPRNIADVLAEGLKGIEDALPTYTEGDGIDISAQKEISVDTTFTEASTRANIASGDLFSTILGKIKKFFTDLKAVAFSGAAVDVTYGSGTVKDALDGLTSVVLEKISISDIGALSNGASGYKSGTCPSHSGYTPVMAVSQASRLGTLGGNLITNCTVDGNVYYMNYKAFTDISAANSAINIYILYQKTS